MFKKKLAVLCLGVSAVCMLAACTPKTNVKETTQATTEAVTVSESIEGTPVRSGKIRIDFEGTVTEIDGRVLTLDSGKKITVSDDASISFAGEVRNPETTTNELSVEVGDFVQGAANDGNADADEITSSTLHVIPMSN